MKQFGLTLIAFLFTAVSFSQKIELGKITIEELKEKKHPKDTSAVAAILFEKGNTYFVHKQGEGFKLITEVEAKIKIYKKGGYDWANKTVSYYVGGNIREEVEFSKAITYNLVGNSIEKTKLKSEGEFTEKTNKYWEKKKIVMPNIKEGSIIEYRYTITSPYISNFPEWYFQSLIPVNYSEYVVKIPEYFNYNVYRKGFVSPLENKKVNDKKIVLVEKSLNMQGAVALGYNTNKEEIDYKEHQTHYVLEDIPAIREEAFSNNITNYVASVQHELASKKMPNSQTEYFSLTWDDVAKSIYESNGFGDELKKTKYFEAQINKLTKDLATNEEKIGMVFSFVKSEMNWDGYNGISCEKGVKKAFEDKIGNVAEINLMLTAMLRYAGIEANPVLLSTRANGIAVYPNRSGFDYVVSAVEIENGLILLDATNKFCVPNVLPERALNWVGRIIRENGSSAQVDLMSDVLSKRIVNAMVAIGQDGMVTGKVREQYYDYYAFNFRNQYAGMVEEAYLEKLEKKYNNIEIENYKGSNKTDLYKQVVEDYSFKHNGLVDIVGDKMYLHPMLFFAMTENPLKQDKRDYPVDYLFPNQNKFIISLNLPEGYQIESLPSTVNLSMEGGLGSLTFDILGKGNQVQLMTTININTAVIPASYYPILKDFYKIVVEKNKEKIVLKKA